MDAIGKKTNIMWMEVELMLSELSAKIRASLASSRRRNVSPRSLQKKVWHQRTRGSTIELFLVSVTVTNVTGEHVSYRQKRLSGRNESCKTAS